MILSESGILDDESVQLLIQQGLAPSHANALSTENNMTHVADPAHENAYAQTHG